MIRTSVCESSIFMDVMDVARVLRLCCKKRSPSIQTAEQAQKLTTKHSRAGVGNSKQQRCLFPVRRRVPWDVTPRATKFHGRCQPYPEPILSTPKAMDDLLSDIATTEAELACASEHVDFLQQAAYSPAQHQPHRRGRTNKQPIGILLPR